jgi:hypothetical protein
MMGVWQQTCDLEHRTCEQSHRYRRALLCADRGRRL